MPGRYRQLRMRDPDVFLLLPATSLAHRHARILRTFPGGLFSFCFTYPDLHHGLLSRFFRCERELCFISGFCGIATAWLLSGMDAASHLKTVATDEAVQAVAKEFLERIR